VDIMTSIRYTVGWDDSGCLLSCWHEHPTISEAAECINCAGAYVLAIENGVLRSLTADEQREFQQVNHAPIDTPPPVRAMSVNRPMRREGETLVEYVGRVLEAYGINQPTLTREGNQRSHVSAVRTSNLVSSVFGWLDKWETRELERIFALQVPAWVEALGKRVRRVLKHKV
jgi:hypothetical protein